MIRYKRLWTIKPANLFSICIYAAINFLKFYLSNDTVSVMYFYVVTKNTLWLYKYDKFHMAAADQSFDISDRDTEPHGNDDSSFDVSGRDIDPVLPITET